MAEAIGDANPGEIIKLTESFTLTETLSIDKDITLDLNGETLTSTAEVGVVVSDCALTIENGTVDGNGAGIKLTGDAELVVAEDAIVRADNNGSYFNSGDAIRAYGQSKVTVNGTVIGAGADGSMGIEIYDKATVTVTETAQVRGYRCAFALYANSSNVGSDANNVLVIEGGEIISDTNAAIVISNHDDQSANDIMNVTINGGTFNAAEEIVWINGNVSGGIGNKGIVNVTINGGNFGGKPFAQSTNAVNETVVTWTLNNGLVQNGNNDSFTVN